MQEEHELADLLHKMKNNSMIAAVTENGGPPKFVEERIEQCLVLANNIDLIHVTCMVSRPGVGKFQSYLEHEFFPPGTAVNDEMQYRVLKWEDTVWFIISIPIEKRDCLYKAAEATNMRIADGVPIIMAGTDDGKGRTSAFPLWCDRAYSLENCKDSVIYEGFGGQQDERVSEKFWLDKYLQSKGILEVPEEDDADWWKDS